jgi:hypothetical protein
MIFFETHFETIAPSCGNIRIRVEVTYPLLDVPKNHCSAMFVFLLALRPFVKGKYVYTKYQKPIGMKSPNSREKGIDNGKILVNICVVLATPA